jgi:hypothetical protein
MAESRIYHVEMYGKANGQPIDHLVDAKSRAAAARHIIEAYGAVELASTKVVAHLVQRGVPVEVAAEAPSE